MTDVQTTSPADASVSSEQDEFIRDLERMVDDISHEKPDQEDVIRTAIQEEAGSTISSRIRSATSSQTPYLHLKTPGPYDFEDKIPEKRDVEVFAEWASGSKKSKKTEVWNQLFAFACCKCYETLTEEQKQFKSRERWALLRDEFRQFLLNFPKTNDGKQRVLHSFEGVWPPEFEDYATKKLASKWTPKFLEENRTLANLNLDREVAVDLAGGKFIESTAHETKSVINNKLNPHYGELPSGHEDDSLMLLRVRKYQWHDNCKKLADNAVRQKKGNKDITISAEYTNEMAMEKEYKARMDKMTFAWYPVAWFTFLMMGKPAGDHMSYISRSGEANTSKTFAPNEQLAGIAGKHGRKRFHKQTNKDTSMPPPSTPKTKRSKTSKVSSATSTTSGSASYTEMESQKLLIALLEKEIKLLENFGPPDKDDEVCRLKGELLKMVSHSRKCMQKSFPDIFDLTKDDKDDDDEEENV